MLVQQYQSLLMERVAAQTRCLDTNPESPTYGCCDPAWWQEDDPDHGALPRPNMRWQELGCTLAMLYRSDWPDNPYFDDLRVAEWVRAILRFWALEQNEDGSFTESVDDGSRQGPTATTTAALGQAWLRLQPFMTREEKQICLPAFQAAADFLIERSNPVQTHLEAAALDALICVHRILPHLGYDEMCRHKFRQFRALQERDGWFREFDGPDFTQNTILLYHLARYYLASGDKQAQPTIQHLLKFLQHFLYPDGLCGGGFSTLSASGLTPGGFALLQDDFAVAREILPFAMESLVSGHTAEHLDHLDYRLVTEFYKYLEALTRVRDDADIAVKDRYSLPATSGEMLDRSYASGKVRVAKRPNYYAVCGPCGGIASLYSYQSETMALFSSPTHQTALSGLLAEDERGVVWSSMLAAEEERKEMKTHTIADCRLRPLAGLPTERWTGERVEYPAEFLERWARDRKTSTRLMRRLLDSHSRSWFGAMARRRAEFDFDDAEVIHYKRRVDYKPRGVASKFEIALAEGAMPPRVAALHETILIPPYRELDKFEIRAGHKTIPAGELTRRQNLEGEGFLLSYRGAFQLYLQFSEPQKFSLRLVRPQSGVNNHLRYLAGASQLQIHVDIRATLAGERRAALEYEFILEERRSRV